MGLGLASATIERNLGPMLINDNPTGGQQVQAVRQQAERTPVCTACGGTIHPTQVKASTPDGTTHRHQDVGDCRVR